MTTGGPVPRSSESVPPWSVRSVCGYQLNVAGLGEMVQGFEGKRSSTFSYGGAIGGLQSQSVSRSQASGWAGSGCWRLWLIRVS
jgi:hypothetical protein